MTLHWGVIPQELPPPATMQELVTNIDQLVRDKKFATVGQRVIVVGGTALGTPGTMNGIVIHTVGDRYGGEDVE